MIKRELLLVMKTNNYLRAIDRRLGNPNNTFSVINDVTWKVFRSEISQHISMWQYMREIFRYYAVRAGLFVMYLGLRMRMMLGMHFDAEALKDFDLDVTYH